MYQATTGYQISLIPLNIHEYIGICPFLFPETDGKQDTLLRGEYTNATIARVASRLIDD